MDFLSLALQCSFLPVSIGNSEAAFEPMIESPGIVVSHGRGEPSRTGDRITLDYWVRDERGKEIANSERRGICLTFDLFGQPGDVLLNAATLGAREGEERFVVLLTEEWVDQAGPLNLIRAHGPLLVRIKVARVDRR